MHTCNITPNTTVSIADTSPMTFEGAKFVPYGTYWDTTINQQVDLYAPHVDLIKRYCDNGSEWYFFSNDGKESDDDTFGIKIRYYQKDDSNYLSHVLATFQRQQKAHDNDVAPPAHRMIKIICNDGKIYWGYTTGIAEGVGTLDTSAGWEDEYDDWAFKKKEVWDYYSTLKSAADDIEGYLESSSIDTDDIESNIEAEYPSGIESFGEWVEWRGLDIADINLKDNLECVDISGCQRDWKPLGETYQYGCLGGDLHSNNIGVWQGSVVCIDFGHHSVQ